MQSGINIEQVKQYNALLRQYKEQATKLKAEIEFNKQELERKCAALSAELGVSVTPDNVKQILEERIEKINNTMSIGTEILNRIASEERQAAQPTPTMNMGAPNPNMGVHNMGAQNMGVHNAGVPNTGTPFNVTPPSTAPNIGSGFPDMSDGLPPIFANR